jgi:hypothetical protein
VLDHQVDILGLQEIGDQQALDELLETSRGPEVLRTQRH